MLIKRFFGETTTSIDFFNFNIPPYPPSESGAQRVRLLNILKARKDIKKR
jgi:hypothetical protein